MFAVDPVQRTLATAAIQVGPVEITIRDLGGVDILLRKFASDHNISLEDARKQALDELREGAAALAAANPDVPAAIDAVAEFIANPRGSLTIRLTPKVRVSLLGLIAAMRQNAAATVSAFRIAAAVTR